MKESFVKNIKLTESGWFTYESRWGRAVHCLGHTQVSGPGGQNSGEKGRRKQGRRIRLGGKRKGKGGGSWSIDEDRGRLRIKEKN